MKTMILILFGVISCSVLQAQVQDIPGDVNGDGSYNIGDSVYILTNLFNNGPDPAPLALVQPETQQNDGGFEFDTRYIEIGGLEPMLQDAFESGRHWVLFDADTNTPRPEPVTFADADAELAFMNSVNYGGFNDWRRPTPSELYSLNYYDSVEWTTYQGPHFCGFLSIPSTGLDISDESVMTSQIGVPVQNMVWWLPRRGTIGSFTINLGMGILLAYRDGS